MKDIYKQIVNISSDGIWVSDKNDVIVITNKSLEKIAGAPRSEIINKNVLTDFPEETTENFTKYYLKAKSTLKPVSYEAKVVTLSGEETWQVGQLTPIVTNKLFDGIICTVKEITKYKKSEENLREKTETINAIIETSQDWIWEIDLNGIHTYSNPAIKTILGYPVNRILGSTSFSLMHEDDRKMIKDKLPLFISEKRGWSALVIRWKHINGEWKYLESNAVPIIDRNDKIIGFRGVDRDITEQKKLDIELKESEERFRKLSESAFEGIGISYKGIVQDANNQLAEMLKISLDKLIGMNAIEFVAPESRKIVEEHLMSGSEEPYEHLAMRADGSVFPVEVRARVIPQEGKTLRITTIRDITDRKEREEELKNHKENLEEMIKKRTKELEEKTAQLDTSVKVFVGREQKIIQLQDEIKKLKSQINSKR